MKIRFIVLFFIFFNSCYGKNINLPRIPRIPYKQYRKLRLQYYFILKKNNIKLESYTKERVLENMYTIAKDDLSNDILYFMKFYNLLNDEQSSYLYIIFYEIISFMIRNEKKISELHISFINIFAYILIKNIIINHYIHHLY